MTGEMSWIAQDGADSNGDRWELHARLAADLKCELRPFDVYIGPYIKHPKGKVWIESEDGRCGRITVWPRGVAPAFCEPLTEEFAEADSMAEVALRLLAMV